MIGIGDCITLDNDKWHDAGKKYYVLNISYRPNSTAVDLVLEDENSNIFQRCESVHALVLVDQND